MEDPQKLAELFERYPSIKKAFETGVESHDGREQELQAFIHAHENIDQIRGNPTRVLEAMDEFSAKKDFLISIGGHKANILSELIRKEAPKTTVELGGYLGYSAILFADIMRQTNTTTNDFHVWSLELNAEFAAIARDMIDVAGLGDIITVVVGTAENTLKQLKNDDKVKKVDFLFLDHAEELYVADFKVCESLNLLRPGSVIVADNVVRPGAPDYRALVRGRSSLKSEGVRGLIQPADLEDELEITYVLG